MAHWPLVLVVEGVPRSGKNSQQVLVNKRTGGRFVKKSKAAAAWQELATLQIRQQFKGKPHPGPCSVHVDIYQKGTLNDCDGDNVQALVLDTLKGAVIADDNSRVLTAGSWTQHVDRARPRVEITVRHVA